MWLLKGYKYYLSLEKRQKHQPSLNEYNKVIHVINNKKPLHKVNKNKKKTSRKLQNHVPVIQTTQKLKPTMEYKEYTTDDIFFLNKRQINVN